MVDKLAAWCGGHGEWLGNEHERVEGGEDEGSGVEHAAWIWGRLGGVGGIAGRAAVLCSCEWQAVLRNCVAADPLYRWA